MIYRDGLTSPQTYGSRSEKMDSSPNLQVTTPQEQTPVSSLQHQNADGWESGVAGTAMSPPAYSREV